MTNLSALGSAALPSVNLPRGGSPVELHDMLAHAPSGVGRPLDSRPLKTRALTGRLVSGVGKPGVVQQSVEQIKASAKAYVEKCWQGYIRKFPEAFSIQGGPEKKTPTLIFLRTQAEVDELVSGDGDKSSVDALVRTDDPTRVYVNLNNFVNRVNKLGPEYMRSVLSHELAHSLTNPVIVRGIDDSVGNSTSYPGVAQDLASNFSFGESEYRGGLTQFSVAQLLEEFTAEHYSKKAEAIMLSGPAYAPVRATGEKLLRLVGEKVFDKAMLQNDPVSYKKVVTAAKTLQVQNSQSRLLTMRTSALAELRHAQAAAPFGTASTAASFSNIEARYRSERQVHLLYKNSFAGQIVPVDLRLFNAVNANLKNRGVVFDSSRAADWQREVTASIRAVWPSLK
jgi:hypothetical protein